jgi:four helix bundle protein
MNWDCRICHVSRAERIALVSAFANSGTEFPGIRLTARGLCDATGLAMNRQALELQERTRQFATAVIRFCDRLPTDGATQKIVDQLLDSSGSTDSNYRATCRARTPAEFIAKIGIAAEEADESKGWLELLVAAGRASIDEARNLIKEADELTAIFVASRKTAERRKLDRERLQQQIKRSRQYRPLKS